MPGQTLIVYVNMSDEERRQALARLLPGGRVDKESERGADKLDPTQAGEDDEEAKARRSGR